MNSSEKYSTPYCAPITALFAHICLSILTFDFIFNIKNPYYKSFSPYFNHNFIISQVLSHIEEIADMLGLRYSRKLRTTTKIEYFDSEME